VPVFGEGQFLAGHGETFGTGVVLRAGQRAAREVQDERAA